MSAEQAAPGAPRPGGIPLCVPELSGNEWAYTRECLDTGWVSSAGPFVDRFEREMEAALGGGLHAVATASGTAALHLALIGAGVRADDEVLVSALTFIAPANTIRYVGARPVFVDAEPTHWQMDVDQVRAFLEDRCESGPDGPVDRATGRRIGAIVPVHILGHPVDMAPLLQTAARFGVPVVEDATESLGARYQGRAVGSLGQFGCLSFNGNKMLTTGGGGMLLTPDAGLARQARHLSTQAKSDPVEYVHDAVGYNYRLTNLQAAVGVAQLERMGAFLAAKRAIAARYATAFAGVPGLRFMEAAPWAEPAWWLSTVLVDEAAFGCSARALMAWLDAAGVQTRPLWQPLHRSPVYPGALTAGEGCPVAERLALQGLNLPSSVGLSQADQERVIALVLGAQKIAHGGGRSLLS